MSEHMGPQALADFVARERELPLGATSKAVPPQWVGLSAAEVGRRGDGLAAVGTPLLTLAGGRARSNIATMATWCASRGVLLAPHGKTTMCPQLWLAQLVAGAWAITVANEPQLRAARAAGVERVVVANLLLRPQGLAWVAQQQDSDPRFEVLCWVDSLASVAQMTRALREAGAVRPVQVLVELGASGARTGARDVALAAEVARAASAAGELQLVGVSGYEGSLAHGTGPEDLARVDGLLGDLARLHRELGDLLPAEGSLLSAGGSAYFDRVVDTLGPYADEAGAHLVMRSGSYVAHDDGIYTELTPASHRTGPEFAAALHGWARVLSMPEPGIAYLDAGRRDLPDDEGWPVAQLAFRWPERGGPRDVSACAVRAMNDQHLHLEVPEGVDLRVGDVVRFGISHPCTAFDKWPLIPVIDDPDLPEPGVTDLIRTYF